MVIAKIWKDLYHAVNSVISRKMGLHRNMYDFYLFQILQQSEKKLFLFWKILSIYVNVFGISLNTKDSLKLFLDKIRILVRWTVYVKKTFV